MAGVPNEPRAPTLRDLVGLAATRLAAHEQLACEAAGHFDFSTTPFSLGYQGGRADGFRQALVELETILAAAGCGGGAAP